MSEANGSKIVYDDNMMTVDDKVRIEERKAESFTFGENLGRALNSLTMFEIWAIEEHLGRPMEKWTSTQRMVAAVYGHEKANGKQWTDVAAMSSDEIEQWVREWAAAHPKSGTSGNAKTLRTSKQNGPQR